MNFYVQTVFGILGHPRLFFSEFPLNMGMRRALFFLLVSALFSCAASLMNVRPDTLFLMAGIYLFNALGMVFIMTALGYVVMILCVGKKMPFARLFSIYALLGCHLAGLMDSLFCSIHRTLEVVPDWDRTEEKLWHEV